MTNKQYLDYNATAPLRDSVKQVLKVTSLDVINEIKMYVKNSAKDKLS